jgi:hypothetical protein
MKKNQLKKLALSKYFKICIVISIMLAAIAPLKTYATDIYPISFNPNPSGVSGGGTYCQNTAANSLYIYWATGQCSTGSPNYVPITITWYANTTSSNTGGTQVNIQNTNSSVTSCSYTPSTATPGTLYYYVVVSWNAGSCAPGGSITSSTYYNSPQVTVYASPIASISASSNPICAGSTVTLTAGETASGGSQFTYTWSATANPPPNNSYTNTTSYTVSVTPTATDTYTLTVTDNLNCVGKTVLTVSVNPNPVASLTTSSNTICNGGSSTLTASESGGTHPFNYTWQATSNPPSSVSNNLTSYNVTVTPTANDTYTLTVTDNNNCVGTAVKAITVNPLPVVTASASPSATICAGNSVTLTGGGASTYTWTNGVTDAVAFTPSGTTTYILNATDVNGCVNTISKIITVNLLPAVTANPAATIVACAGTSITLTGGGATSYTWTGGITNGTPFNASSTQTYTVTGTDANGCVNSASKTVTINPLPTVTVSATATVVCVGTSVTLTAAGANTYTWTPSISNGVAFSPSSSQTYTVTGTDVNSCTNTATQSIAVNSLPTVGAHATQTLVCTGHMVTFSGSGANTYTWSSGVTNGIGHVVSSAQNFTVTGTDANNCKNTAVVSISVITPPTPDICMVTVDSTSTHNIIYWNKTLYPSADSFFVYRDTANNNYALIGKRPKDSLSLFIDTARHIGAVNGNPNVGTYRYKIAIKDSCGNISSLSPYHNTVYTTPLGGGTFSYNQYGIEGQSTPVPGLSQYVLKRDNFNTGSYVVASTIGAGSTSITDPSYTTYQATANWVVETNWTTICTPTLHRGNNSVQAAVVKSRSNVRNNRMININQVISNNSILVYPNPANNELTVSLANNCDNCHIEIINLLGQSIKNILLTSTESKISVADLPSGAYYLKVKSNGKEQYLQKLIVQH